MGTQRCLLKTTAASISITRGRIYLSVPGPIVNMGDDIEAVQTRATDACL